ILRRRDALGRVDKDEAVPKATVQKHRDGDERMTAVARGEIARGGDFCSVEVLVAQKAPVTGRRVHGGQHGQVDAVSLDRAVLEGAHDLVVAAGERQRNILGHVCLGRICREGGGEGDYGFGGLSETSGSGRPSSCATSRSSRCTKVSRLKFI